MSGASTNARTAATVSAKALRNALQEIRDKITRDRSWAKEMGLIR
jgi:hypothetical protein